MKGKGGKKARGTRASGGSVPRRGITNKAKKQKRKRRERKVGVYYLYSNQSRTQ